ncbi:MAG: Rrf2 family transcriptional regulator, partial [Akkermansiaceae bacterium]|nr:Rrf2 family transcriptional regulator [Akkermansiaceae bacterium]
MHLSKKAEYALRAMIHLGIATEMGVPTVSGVDLAEANRLPLKFIERILQ